jgi:mono/diheme cytochrome c family protein
MTRNLKRLVFAAIGLVVLSTALLSWTSIRKESAHTDPLPEPSTQVVASDSYAWVDREHGVAAIPVSRAMDIIGQKGLPWGPVAEEPAPQPVVTAAAKPAGPKLDPERVQAGQAVFAKRCQGCHAEGTKYPPVANRYGTKVELEGGGQAVFDEAYIRESITDPGAKIAATYKVMPKLPNLTDDDVQNLTIYIHSLTK